MTAGDALRGLYPRGWRPGTGQVDFGGVRKAGDAKDE